MNWLLFTYLPQKDTNEKFTLNEVHSKISSHYSCSVEGLRYYLQKLRDAGILASSKGRPYLLTKAGTEVILILTGHTA